MEIQEKSDLKTGQKHLLYDRLIQPEGVLRARRRRPLRLTSIGIGGSMCILLHWLKPE
jgi:hypothetical protein